MITWTSPVRVYACLEPTDIRKSFDGLCGVVELGMGRRLEAGSLFLFFNWRLDRVKILQAVVAGMVLFYKRQEAMPALRAASKLHHAGPVDPEPLAGVGRLPDRAGADRQHPAGAELHGGGGRQEELPVPRQGDGRSHYDDPLYHRPKRSLPQPGHPRLPAGSPGEGAGPRGKGTTLDDLLPDRWALANPKKALLNRDIENPQAHERIKRRTVSARYSADF